MTTGDALGVLRVAVGLPADAPPRYVLVDSDLAAMPATGLEVPGLALTLGDEQHQILAILVGDVV